MAIKITDHLRKKAEEQGKLKPSPQKARADAPRPLDASALRAILSLVGFPEPREQCPAFGSASAKRFHFAWVEMHLAIDLPHTLEDFDLDKHNWARMAGWDAYAFTGKMLANGQALATLKVLFQRLKEGELG